MSYVLCPECGAANSSISTSCPRCGFPIVYLRNRKCLVSIDFDPFENPDKYAEAFEGSWKNSRRDYLPSCEVALNPFIPVSLQYALSQSEDSRVRHALASNPSVGSSILMELVNDETRDVSNAAFSRMADYPELLESLSYSNNENVRVAVASCEFSGQSVLARLAKDGADCVRLAVACNEATSDAILETLIYDKCDDVVLGVFNNPSAGRYTIGRIATRFKGNRRMEQAMLESPIIPNDLRDSIIRDQKIRTGTYRVTYYGQQDERAPEISDPDSPLYGYHYDEDNGAWLDYYPED